MPHERFEAGAVSGFLHRASQGASDGLALTHGAGGDCSTPLLVAVADALQAAGISVLRFDLPFRRKGKPPSPAGAAADRAGIEDAVTALRGVVSGRIFMGGQSYGGRQASMLAAESPNTAAGLLLLSYPLHPPGKPESLRTAHFQSLRCPALFVHGSRDPFGSLEEFRAAIALIAARTEFIEIEGAGHDLKRGKFDTRAMVIEPFSRLVRLKAQ